ncbi:hypothetical protein BH18ACT5_BH18ACT5_01300 [soil metagenome]
MTANLEPAHRARLDKELILWITTVRADGQPQSHPVWFTVDGDHLLMWSKEGDRTRNLRDNNRVAVHVSDNGRGGDVLTIEGIAHIEPGLGPGSQHPEFVRRYQPLVDSSKNDWAWFDSTYKIPVRITPQKIRGS